MFHFTHCFLHPLLQPRLMKPRTPPMFPLSTMILSRFFNKAWAMSLTEHWPYYCPIDLLPGTSPLKGWLYSLACQERGQSGLCRTYQSVLLPGRGNVFLHQEHANVHGLWTSSVLLITFPDWRWSHLEFRPSSTGLLQSRDRTSNGSWVFTSFRGSFPLLPP